MGDKTVYDRVDDLEVRIVSIGNDVAALRLMLSNLEKRLFTTGNSAVGNDSQRHKPFTVRGK
jgi:hypothetical protein